MKRALAIVFSFISLFGCGGEDPPLAISVFTSSASAVARGRPVTLAWSVQNADTVRLIREPDTVLLDNHAVLEGSQLTAPLERSTAFTLFAVRGEESINQTLRVTALGSNERVAITKFEADTASAQRGQPVTLSWTTVAASGASITTDAGATVLAAADLPSGTLQVMPTASTRYIFEALGPGGPARSEVMVTVRRPSIEAFAANPAAITVGESSDIGWTVTQATNVTIIDQNNNEIFNGTDQFGTAPVMPAETTIYTLTATDDGGSIATSMLTITVTDPVQAEIMSFTATPNATDIGEPSILAWSVRNAPGGIAIEAGGSVLLRSAERMGTFSVVQAVSTTYTLTAFSSGGNATRTALVSSNPSPPAIITFEATPTNTILNTSTSLSWNTLGATNVEILRGDSNGAVEYTATNDTNAGATNVLVTNGTTMFTIRAANANGARTQTVTVRAFSAPRIVGLTVTPLTFSSTPAQVSLGWSTADAQNVDLFVAGVRDAAFPGTTVGNHSVTIGQTTIFELVARNPAAAVSRTVVVAATVGETEPNDTAATAFTGATNGGNTPGSISREMDVDWFELTVPMGGGIRAETSDGMGGCAIDTVLELHRATGGGGTLMLGRNDEGGNNGCSLIDRQVDPYARDLTAGTYYVRVESESGPGLYTLQLSIAAASCPNGIQEINNPAGAEQCDDNNSNDTDECSNTCLRNIDNLGTVTGLSAFPAAASSFLGRITPVGHEQFVTLNLTGITGGAYVMARTYAAAEPACTADTVLTLYDANFQAIGQNDQSGVDDCSVLNPGVDGLLHTFTDVPPGTYYLGVGEFGADAVISAYQINVRAESRDRCGNRVTEGTEQCDDGNTITTDGCSACVFTGLVESEPNNGQATSDDATASPRIRGRIGTAGDEDWFRIAVPNGNSLEATLSNGLGGCSSEVGGIRGTITLYSEVASNPGTLTLLGSASSNALDCAAIDGRRDTFARSLSTTLNYYLKVEETDGTGTGLYVLDVTPIAPGCGNTLVETGEQCDDGNAATGDGCDICRFEITSTVTATGTMAATDTMTIPVGGFGVVRVHASANTDVRVITSDVGGTTCNISTVAAIIDTSGSLLGAEETGAIAPGTCARINPPTSAFATNLSGPATYYMLVFNDDLIAITAEVTTTLLP